MLATTAAHASVIAVVAAPTARAPASARVTAHWVEAQKPLHLQGWLTVCCSLRDWCITGSGRGFSSRVMATQVHANDSSATGRVGAIAVKIALADCQERLLEVQTGGLGPLSSTASNRESPFALCIIWPGSLIGSFRVSSRAGAGSCDPCRICGREHAEVIFQLGCIII